MALNNLILGKYQPGNNMSLTIRNEWYLFKVLLHIEQGLVEPNKTTRQ